MTAAECEQRMTVRERDAWLVRIRDEIFAPDKVASYLMQNTAYLSALLKIAAGHRGEIKIDPNAFVLRREGDEPQMSEEEMKQHQRNMIALSQSMWTLRMRQRGVTPKMSSGNA